MLKARNDAFKSGDMAAFRTARANLNCDIRVAKRAYGRKVQDFFQDPINTRRMLQGIQVIVQTTKLPLPPATTTSTLSTNLTTALGGLRHSTPLL